MANLIVRNVDEEVVRALKERAGRRGHSAEAEHRLILASALEKPTRKSFVEVLAAMPDVGEDGDFARTCDDPGEAKQEDPTQDDPRQDVSD